MIFSYRVVTTDHSVAAEDADICLSRDVYIVTSLAEIVFKLASLDHAVGSAVGLCTLK